MDFGDILLYVAMIAGAVIMWACVEHLHIPHYDAFWYIVGGLTLHGAFSWVWNTVKKG